MTFTPAKMPTSWCVARRSPPKESLASKPQLAARTRRSARMLRISLEACAVLQRRFPDLDLLLIESGGDNLAATFSPELVDATIYVIDVAEGDKIPRKGGPGITNSGLLVINKIDLAPYVGASLEVMERDTTRIRGGKPHVFTNLKDGTGMDAITSWIQRTLLFES